MGIVAAEKTSIHWSELCNTMRISIAGIVSSLLLGFFLSDSTWKLCFFLTLWMQHLSAGRGGICIIKCKQCSHDAMQTHLTLPRYPHLKQLGRNLPVARLGFKSSSKLVWSCRRAPDTQCSDPALGNSCASPHLWLGWYFEGKLGLVYVLFLLFPWDSLRFKSKISTLSTVLSSHCKWLLCVMFKRLSVGD